jgi:uncharacterized membrane protein YqjE
VDAPTTERNGSGVGPAAKSVAEHVGALARLELRLAAIELKQKAASLGIGRALIAVAGICGFFLLAFLFAAAGAAWTLVLPAWAAMLAMAGTLLLLAGALVAIGLAAIRRSTPPLPEQAIAEARLTREALRGD